MVIVRDDELGGDARIDGTRTAGVYVSEVLTARFLISVRIYTGGDVIALEWSEHWSYSRMIGNGRTRPHRVDSGVSRLIKSEDKVTYPRRHRRTAIV